MTATTHPAPAPAGRPVSRTTLYLFGALGGILFGYDLGIISGVLPFIGKQWHLDSWDKGVVTASVSVGAVLGAAISAKVNLQFGRRHTIQAAALIVLVMTIFTSTAPSFHVLTLARFAVGIGIGLSSSTVPTYMSELAPARLRGGLGALNQIFIVLGILIAFITSYCLGEIGGDYGHWRWMMAGAAVPALVLLIGLQRLPETPRWLLTRGRDDEAAAVLLQAHGSQESADAELATLRAVIADTASTTRGRLRDLWRPMVRPMLIVAILLAAGQQLSGVNAIGAYFPTMLISLGFATQTALLSGVLLGLSKFVFTAWVVFVVDKWGRKPLLLIGSCLMAITLAGAGFVSTSVHDTSTRGVLMLVLIIVYLVGYELGWGAVVWVMCSEVFPLRDRASGMAVASVVLWSFTGVVTAVFPLLSAKSGLGLGGAMYLFAVVNVVLLVLTKWLVPETKGRSLEQIELDLRRGKDVVTEHAREATPAA